MVDISIVELIVYGFFAYSSALMLILQVIKEPPLEKSGSILRSIFLIPGIVSSFVIALSGQNLNLTGMANTIIDTNSTTVWTEAITTQIILQNPIWSTFHFMLGILMIVYVMLQTLTLFTKIK